MLYQLELLACKFIQSFPRTRLERERVQETDDGYFVSRWTVCFRSKRQYFFSSIFAGVCFLFFIVW